MHHLVAAKRRIREKTKIILEKYVDQTQGPFINMQLILKAKVK